MTAAEFARRYGELSHLQVGDDFAWDHSLRSLAMRRASRPGKLHVGTAHDWEDLDRYREELERMETEGLAPREWRPEARATDACACAQRWEDEGGSIQH